ncbi:MAG: B12-binding domain-containing radical SAM protein, partial [Leptospiraceae bacterium]|nr:B12-binding domain-containing radical SAM protein [Leptospiraceae bacterium]
MRNSRNSLVLLQLPVPPPAYYASTGNVPLASAALAGAYNMHGKNKLPIYVFSPEITDVWGDEKLVELILEQNPRVLGLSLYLWNSERSLHIAKKVKESSPETTIVLGGPEVSADNQFLLEMGIWDYCIVGEAEDVFVEFLDLFLTGENYLQLPALGFRENGKIHFNPQTAVDFPLSKYPSPYLSNWIQVEPFRSTYIETVRGCRSKCTYCFYPKSSNTLRGYSLDECKKMFSKLKEMGAKEFVFLDPTFNHRPNFEELLDILIDVNYDKQVRMFAEIRAEGMNSKLAKKLKQANFYRLEIGMQSINKQTLKNVMRYGSPEKVAEVSKMLVEEGIDLLLDLIIGLPGDSPHDVLEGVEFFQRYALEDYLQVFPLSILPGTNMRVTSKTWGIDYLSTPPYRVKSTPTFPEGKITQTLLEVESLLETRIDEFPRPHLVEPKYLFDFSKDPFQIPKNLERHVALWFEGKLETQKEKLLQFIQKIIDKEPFITIDLVFYSERVLEFEFIMDVRKFLNQMKMNYLKYSLSHRNEDMQHRIVLL